jgi:L-threonylcarbamoyladenylate synthase
MEKISLVELLQLDITGKVICFPTDTVYGVGAKHDDLKAIERIFAMKKREAQKPLAILTPNKDIEIYVKEINKTAEKLMAEYWPGAMTLIFNKSEAIDDHLTNGLKTIAFRMPKSDIALSILKKFGLMATTSVNISGEKEINTIEEIEQCFSDYIDYLVVDQAMVSQMPSSIIDVTQDLIKQIR